MSNIIIEKDKLNQLLLIHQFKQGPDWYLILPNREDLEYQRSINRKKNSVDKECIICNTIFNYGYTNTNTCGACKLISKCSDDWCDNWYIKEKITINDLNCINNNLPINRCCSTKCATTKHNKSPKMRAKSKALGEEWGSKNAKKAHEKDGWYSCNECNDKDCKVRNKLEKNKIVAGFGCFTKLNSSDKMKENSSKIAIENWENGIFTDEQSTKNLGKWASMGRYIDICPIHGKTIFMSNNCLLCNPKAAGATGKEYRVFNNNSPCDNRCPDFENCFKINRESNLIVFNPPKNYLGVCEQYILNHNGVFSPLWYIFDQININCNSNCKNINVCNNKVKEIKNKNIFGFCDIVADQLHGKVKRIEMKFCKNCNCETPHKYINDVNIIDDNIINNIENTMICMVCNNERIWCNKCNQFESISYNSIPEHWNMNSVNNNINIFILINKWKLNHKNEIKFLENNIIGFNKLLDNKIHCGIYKWYVDNVPFYYGKSTNIFRRSYEHFVTIIDFQEWWINIFEEIKNGHNLEIKFNEYKENELDYWEKYWILKDKPMSQKCTNNGNYDNIISLNNRDFNINNLRKKYEERLNKI